MNIYYSYLGRLLDGRTPFDRDGYYVLYEDGNAGYSRSKPDGAEIVSAASFVDAVAEGCRTAIRGFAASEDNKQVYAFSLDANDHSDFFIYINTQDRFEQTLSQYQSTSPEYHKEEYIQSLKFNQGDWDFQLWSKHMGEHGRIILSFENLANRVQDLEDSEAYEGGAEPVIAFEAGIVKKGYQVLAMRAVMRLVEEHAFDVLDRTDDFIAFASTENDYIDYSIIMRRTIDPERFARVFPNEREKDLRFEQSMKELQHYTVSEALNYWFEADKDPYEYDRTEYETFLQLERYGAALAEECLARLQRIVNLASWKHQEYEEIDFYVEALHFSGSLSDESAEKCRAVAAIMGEKFDDMEDTVQQLLALASH